MKTLDRMILAVIALALAVIALNPWVAPGYVTAQSKTMDVNITGVSAHVSPLKMNIVELGGHRVSLPLARPTDSVAGVPVIVLNVNDLRK